MALSKEREKELTDYFIFKLWPEYPADLCEGVRQKGPRGEALKVWLKQAPTDEECERILGNLKAQVRYDRREKSMGNKPARWPHCRTYLYQRRYDDEITCMNLDEGESVAALATCKTEGCDCEVIGPRFKFCPDCYAKEHDPWLEMRRAKMEELGLLPYPGEAKSAYYRRLRDFNKNQLNLGDIGK